MEARQSVESSRTPAAFRHQTGDVLGTKYRLERRIGAGGMGEVWLATNVALDLPVAIKLLHDDPRGRSEHLAQGLMREARTAASMVHPAVVRVYDLGRTYRGDPYIVMERLEGEDLREKLFRDGPMRSREAVRMLLPVIDAIQAAHQRGLIHRDLKPENIVLTRDAAGRTLPKIVDFGIAELRWVEEVDALAGTPDYMAPEQLVEDPKLDHRVDTWALAVMLHEMVSGKPPFEAPSMRETFQRISRGSPDPLPPHVDPRLGEIIMHALSRDPLERPTSARELGETLAKWLMSRGVSDDVAGQSLASTWFGEVEMAPTCDFIQAVSVDELIARHNSDRPVANAVGTVSGTHPKFKSAPASQVPRQGADTATFRSSSPWAAPLPTRGADHRLMGLSIGLVTVAAAALVAVIFTSATDADAPTRARDRIEATVARMF